MIKKTINIPIYHGKLTIIKNPDIKEVNEKYDLGDDECLKYDALTFVNIKSNGFFHSIIIFNTVSSSIIAHEAMHVVSYLFKHNGIEYSIDNDEPQAYLLGWIVKQCDKFLNK